MNNESDMVHIHDESLLCVVDQQGDSAPGLCLYATYITRTVGSGLVGHCAVAVREVADSTATVCRTALRRHTRMGRVARTRKGTLGGKPPRVMVWGAWGGLGPLATLAEGCAAASTVSPPPGCRAAPPERWVRRNTARPTRTPSSHTASVLSAVEWVIRSAADGVGAVQHAPVKESRI
jgi:hypothetical protein